MSQVIAAVLPLQPFFSQERNCNVVGANKLHQSLNVLSGTARRKISTARVRSFPTLQPFFFWDCFQPLAMSPGEHVEANTPVNIMLIVPPAELVPMCFAESIMDAVTFQNGNSIAVFNNVTLLFPWLEAWTASAVLVQLRRQLGLSMLVSDAQVRFNQPLNVLAGWEMDLLVRRGLVQTRDAAQSGLQAFFNLTAQIANLVIHEQVSSKVLRG